MRSFFIGKMLVLVIPQFFFFFNLRLHIIPGVNKRLFLNKWAGFFKVSIDPVP